MTIREVLKLGRLELITITNQVSFPLNNETIKEIDDIKDTLLNIPNSAGLAANQIGINKQIIVYRIPKERVNQNEEYFNDLVVLINPIIDVCSKEKEDGWEGCLSIPSLRAVVPRYIEIHVSGFDEDGVLYEKTVNNSHARNLQHEVDHLNGMTFFDRIQDKKMISFKSELQSGILAIKHSMGNK